MLVVIAIIGTLAGMILPAVQAAREAARLNSCRNNLSQLSKGLLHHETSKGFFPSGGWGPAWLGIASRHSDSAQPGSWVFSVLPYIEERNTQEIVANSTAATYADAYGRLASTVLPGFSCPSRRAMRPMPPGGQAAFYAGYDATSGSVTITTATRSDYAANGGSCGSCAAVTGFKGIPANAVTNAVSVNVCPAGTSVPLPQVATTAGATHAGSCADCGTSLEQDASLDVRGQFPDLASADTWRKKSIGERFSLASDPRLVLPDLQDGMIHRMSRVQAAGVFDGLSNVYLLGEKYVATNTYLTGSDPGDDGPMMAGSSNGTIRSGFEPPTHDTPGVTHATAFGSAHAVVWNAAFGDGSVRSVSYSIDPSLHRLLSARADGAVAAPPGD